MNASKSKPKTTIAFKADSDFAAALDKAVQELDTDRSKFIRAAVRKEEFLRQVASADPRIASHGLKLKGVLLLRDLKVLACLPSFGGNGGDFLSPGRESQSDRNPDSAGAPPHWF